MEGLFLPENVLKLCDLIINALESDGDNKVELSTYLKALKLICKIEESCPRLEEILQCILQSVDTEVLFRSHTDGCHEAADILLNYSHLTIEIRKILKPLLCYCLRRNLNESLLINKLFNRRDIAMMPVDFIEDILLLDSTQFELLLVKLYAENVDNEKVEVWNTDRCNHWITWGARSNKLFYKFCSIMNHMLFIVKNPEAMLKIINNFIKNISLTCERENLNFISLYPLKLQSLVSAMTSPTEGLPSQYFNYLTNFICNQFNDLKKENNLQSLMLITHFNKWEKWVS